SPSPGGIRAGARASVSSNLIFGVGGSEPALASSQRNLSLVASATTGGTFLNGLLALNRRFQKSIQLVFPILVNTLIQHLKSELVMVEALPELLPRDFPADLFKIIRDLSFVGSVGISGQMLSFALDHNDLSN